MVKSVINEVGVNIKDFPDTGGLYSDIHAMAHCFAEHFQTPIIIALNRVVAHNHSPLLNQWLDERWQSSQHKFEVILKRAEARGEFVNHDNLFMAIEVITGPMLLSTIIMNQSINTYYSGQLADLAYGLLTQNTGRPFSRQPVHRSV